MLNSYYNESLIDAANTLIDIRQRIFDVVFGIAITGELGEWNKTIEVGTEIKFTRDIFESCFDSNIHLLLKLMDKVEEAKDSLININRLDY